MKAIGIIVSTVAIVIYSTLLSGWAIVKLCAWFVVPALGVHPLTIPLAIGLALLAGFIQHTPKTEKGKEWGEMLAEAIAAAVKKGI